MDTSSLKKVFWFCITISILAGIFFLVTILFNMIFLYVETGRVFNISILLIALPSSIVAIIIDKIIKTFQEETYYIMERIRELEKKVENLEKSSL